jgi:SAM-dependent methyltransferase
MGPGPEGGDGPETPAAPRRPKQIVRAGWDAVSLRYRPEERVERDPFGHGDREYLRWIEPVLTELPEGARILDLGCGNGWPVSAALAGRFRVTGVDLSPVQIRRARARLPEAEFIEADMTTVILPPGSFSAVLAFYSIVHVPLVEQPGLFDRIARWLAPGGLFIATLGAEAFTGVEPDWRGWGAAMYWSHADRATYSRWLRARGFTVEAETYVPEGDGGHVLFRARNGA